MAYKKSNANGQATMANSEPIVIASDQSSVPVTPAGNVAHDAVDSGNPIKIGGKVSTTAPTAVAAADRVDAWFNEYGMLVTSDYDVEVGGAIGSTGLRDRLMAQRYTVIADSLADGLAGFWTSTTANGGTATSTGGEGVMQTSAAATGSAQISSTITPYHPGQVQWFNSAARFSDTGSAGNIRRIGVYTVSGTTPQDGFYYELSGTTLNAVVVKAGSATATASASWTRATEAPFTLDTNYHSFEIRYTANSVWFYIDNTLRHKVSGTTAAITTTLNFPMTIVSVNTSGATNRSIAVRNCGMGRFGNPEMVAFETGLSAVNAVAVGGGTPHDSVDSGNPLKMGGKALSSAPSDVASGDRVNAYFDLKGRLKVDMSDVALPAGTNAIGKLAANSGVDIGDVDVTSISAGTNLVGDVGIQPRTTNGLDTFMASGSDGSSILVATAQAVKASAGKVYGYYIYNPESAVTFVHFYNTASGSVTVGTTNPLFTLPIPATSGANLMNDIGITFGTAITIAATTTAGGNTAPATGVSAVVWYK